MIIKLLGNFVVKKKYYFQIKDLMFIWLLFTKKIQLEQRLCLSLLKDCGLLTLTICYYKVQPLSLGIISPGFSAKDYNQLTLKASIVKICLYFEVYLSFKIK